jgi:hypothetical protein
MAIADRVYSSKKQPGDQEKLSRPNSMDDKVLANFESWTRLHHKNFNGHLKFFRELSATFRHGLDNHKNTFEAVYVIVQYQIEDKNGGKLFKT